MLFFCALFCLFVRSLSDSTYGSVEFLKSKALPTFEQVQEVFGLSHEDNVSTSVAFRQIFDAAMTQFPVEEYNRLMGSLPNELEHRFLQILSGKVDLSRPHCDADSPQSMTSDELIAHALKNVSNASAGGSESAAANTGANSMISSAVQAMKAMIQMIIAMVVDIVPPMIPPPFWFLQPLPCMPMITGARCLGSILYPITASEFVMADVTDLRIEGTLKTFPDLYRSRAGRTSDSVYLQCAQAYLGMFCSSLWPMCFIPVPFGMRATDVSFIKPCVINCLIVLAACPGFGIADISTMCSTISLPPFCSFATFARVDLIPPQLSGAGEDEDFPESCPPVDFPNTFDSTVPSPIDEALRVEMALGDSLADFMRRNNAAVPLPCDCTCYKLPPLPKLAPNDRNRAPALNGLEDIDLSQCSDRCVAVCRAEARKTYRLLAAEAERQDKLKWVATKASKRLAAVAQGNFASLGFALKGQEDFDDQREKKRKQKFEQKVRQVQEETMSTKVMTKNDKNHRSDATDGKE